MGANRVTAPESSGGNIIFALFTLTNFFDSWSFLLYALATCLFVRVCQSYIYEAHAPTVFPMKYYVPFTLLMVSGTVGVGSCVDIMSFSYIKGRFAGQTISWIEHEVAIYCDTQYALLLLWLMSAVITLLYTALVYKEARRLSLNDKVSIINDLHPHILSAL